MRVLLTGATGLAGCHTAAAVLAKGHRLRLLVRSPEKMARVLRGVGIEKPEQLDHVIGDVTDAEAVETALEGCEAVIHAAAFFTQDTRREAEVQRTNVLGAERVLGAAARRGLDPIVHVSSLAAVFPPDGPVMRPDDRVKQPRDMYARSKAAAEQFARRLQDEGAPVVTVYPGTIIGPEDPTFGDGLRTIMSFVKLGVIPTTAGGIPFVDVRDLAQLHAAALEPGRGARRYMLGGSFLSNVELGAVLQRITQRRIRTVYVPPPLIRTIGRIGDQLQRRFGVKPGLTYEAVLILIHGVPTDDSRAAEELGVECRPVDETLRDTLRWMHRERLIEPSKIGVLSNGNATGQ